MLTSLDGKITFGHVNGKDSEISLFGDYMDLYNQTQEKLNVRAILCGRVTMAEFTDGSFVGLDKFHNQEVNLDEDFIITNDNEGCFFAVDIKGKLRWKESFINLNSKDLSVHKWNLVTIVTKETPKEYLAYLKSKNISYIFGVDKEIDFETVFKKIKKEFGIDRIAVEGGGSINGSIIKQELIDEISLLYVPVVTNNIHAPALFYSELTNPKVYNFKLKNFEKLEKDVLWLRFTKF